jgi:predicted transcriptional regulator
MSADDVAFLVRSPHRGAVLAALAETPADRSTLRECIGASRVTVGRITTDLEERGWVDRRGNEYVVTNAGQAVAGAFERFLDTVETTRRLEPLLEYLPLEAFGFDLAALGDAEVVRPTPTDPGRHLSRLRELFEASDEVLMVVHAVAPRVVASAYEAAMAGDHHTRGVFTPAVTEAIRANPEVRRKVRTMLERGTMEIYERPSVPYQVATFDDTAIVSADDETGVPRGIVVTESPPVRAWVAEEFDRLRADATALSPEAFRVPDGSGGADTAPGP